tara:strand:- start:350 stop:592 length:243 start_codon:yes stop_codon:yes gene_type:complete
MKVEKIDDRIVYSDKDYAFTLTDEKFHRYATLVVRPIHINIVDNKTELTKTDLKNKIIQDWFAEENDSVRESNNKKRRKQ